MTVDEGENSMKKVLLFDTAIATSNLGDEIILEGAKNGLEPVLYNSLNFRLGTHIENYSVIQMLHKSFKVKLFCDEMDYKFICGTNLLQNNIPRVNAQFMLKPFNADIYKNSILVGVGRIGDYKSMGKVAQLLYKKVLSKEFYHSVRDEETKKVIEQLGLKAINTGCPTLWCFTEEKCKSIPLNKSDKVVLSVSGYKSQKDSQKDKMMIETLRNNYKKVYAWIQTSEDEKYLRELVDADEYNIEMIYSLKKYSKVLSEKNIDYVGTRLHGGIYALQHNCRTLIISIDERANGFHETNNIPILKRSEIEKLDAVINSEIRTNIKVNHEAIKQFLNQFEM